MSINNIYSAHASYRQILSDNDTHLLQEDINTIANWASTWLMRFKVSKCCYMQFTQAKMRRINKVYYLHDTALAFSDYCKYLGVTLQSNLRWDKHINEKIANASCTLGLLQRNIKTPSTHIRDLACLQSLSEAKTRMCIHSMITLVEPSH